MDTVLSFNYSRLEPVIYKSTQHILYSIRQFAEIQWYNSHCLM